MKIFSIIIIFSYSSILFSQYDYAIELHNTAREIHNLHSTDYENVDDEGYVDIVKIKYDSELSIKAKERADLLANEFFQAHNGDDSFNFWFTEIPIDENGNKEFTTNENYINYAVNEWIKIDWEYDEYYDLNRDEPLTIKDGDIADLMNAVGYYNSKVGFAVSKSDEHVFVVALYGK